MNEEKIFPKAVFWDLDGTLISSDEYWSESGDILLKKVGLGWSPEISAQLQGTSMSNVVNVVRSYGLEDMTPQEIRDFMVEYVFEREQEAMPWTHGVQDVVSMFQKIGVPQVLVTGSPECLAHNAVLQAPEGAFIGYVSGEDTEVAHKPSPEPYLKAARMAGVDIHDCLIFEDSEPGLTAARDSGAHVVAVTDYSLFDSRHMDGIKNFIGNYEGIDVQKINEFMTR